MPSALGSNAVPRGRQRMDVAAAAETLGEDRSISMVSASTAVVVVGIVRIVVFVGGRIVGGGTRTACDIAELYVGDAAWAALGSRHYGFVAELSMRDASMNQSSIKTLTCTPNGRRLHHHEE